MGISTSLNDAPVARILLMAIYALPEVTNNPFVSILGMFDTHTYNGCGSALIDTYVDRDNGMQFALLPYRNTKKGIR